MKSPFDLQSFHVFNKQLKNVLKKDLPGKKGQDIMKARLIDRPDHKYDFNNTKDAAVLVHLFEKKDTIYCTLIERPKYNGVHSGQISFPGGKVEDDDQSLLATAIREAQEEVHISPDELEILGPLTPIHIAASNHLVYPFIGSSLSIPEFRPQKNEVEQIINFPLLSLLDDSIVKETRLNIRNTKIQAPYFFIEGKIVWGATAMMLSEFKEVLKKNLDKFST